MEEKDKWPGTVCKTELDVANIVITRFCALVAESVIIKDVMD